MNQVKFTDLKPEAQRIIAEICIRAAQRIWESEHANSQNTAQSQKAIAGKNAFKGNKALEAKAQ